MTTKKTWIFPTVLVAALGISLATASLSGCVSTGDGQGVVMLEEMTQPQFNKWRLYIGLSTKVIASRLVSEGLVTPEELAKAAEALTIVRDGLATPEGSATSLLLPALEKVGLKGSEIELALLVIEQEILQRGVIPFLDPVTGTYTFSPRTKDLLDSMINSLNAAATSPVTPGEGEQASKLQSELDSQLLQYESSRTAAK